MEIYESLEKYEKVAEIEKELLSLAGSLGKHSELCE